MSNPVTDKTYALFDTPINKKIIARLNETKTVYFLFPPLETEAVILDDEKKAAALNVGWYDWLIFTDVLAVDFFLQLLTENEIDFFELDAVRVCTFGETVADRLRFVQIHADVIPNKNEAAEIFSAINSYVGVNTPADLKMLLIKRESETLEISDLLSEAKAELIELPIYKAHITDKSEVAKLKTLLKGGAIDEFVFSAPEDLIALKYFFAGNDLPDVLAEIKVSAPDANIYQTLREYDLRPHYFIAP